MKTLSSPSTPSPALRALTLALALSLGTALPLHAQGVATPPAKQARQGKIPPKVAVAAPTPQAEGVREMGGISEYRLPNGLQILLFPDEAQSTTTVNVTYRVGSRHEAPGEYGMAHLLEHMLFKGTPSHRDIPGEFAKRGMQMNGTTTVDRTNYFSSFNADEDTLRFALALEADRMVNSFVAKADLDKEMSVVRNEYERGENSGVQVLIKRVQAVAYDWHNYGHSTIGPKSDIENVPIEHLQAFYKRYYRPDNATLLIAGRFDKARTLAWIAEAFGPLARPAAPVPEPYTVEPPQDGERSVVVRRVGGQPTLLSYYKVPALSHPDSAAILVYGMLMSMPPSGALYKQFVEPKLALGASLGGIGGHDPGGAMALLQLPPDADIAKLQSQWLDLVEGRTPLNFTEAEIQRVRDVVALGMREQMKRPELLTQMISGNLGAGDWRLLFQLFDDMGKVTMADVERVRADYFRPSNRTLGRYEPAKTVEQVEIPVAPPLADRLAALKGPAAVSEGEQFDPTPEHLLTRTATQRLPSGIQLHTLQKKTRGDTVVLQMQVNWGARQAMHAYPGLKWVDELLEEGSARYSKQAVEDELIRLKGGFSVVGGEQGLTITMQAERDTLLPLLAVVADVLRNPKLPADALERARLRVISSLQGSRAEVETLRREATRAHYNEARGVGPDSADYIPSLDEQINRAQAVTLDQVRDAHTRFWQADHAQIAVVGALPDGLGQGIEQLFGDWRKPDVPAFERHRSNYLSVPPARYDVAAKDKPNTVVKLAHGLPLNAEDADALPLMLGVRVLGSGMESRLMARVRQKEGLSYGLGAQLVTADWGNDSSFIMSGTVAPANRDRMIALMQEELATLLDQGITEAELARVKKVLLEERKMARAQEGSLAAGLLNLADHGWTWADTARKDAALQGVTVAQVNEALKKHLHPQQFVISTAGEIK